MGNLFRPDTFIAGSSGAGNNWAKGCKPPVAFSVTSRAHLGCDSLHRGCRADRFDPRMPAEAGGGLRCFAGFPDHSFARRWYGCRSWFSFAIEDQRGLGLRFLGAIACLGLTVALRSIRIECSPLSRSFLPPRSVVDLWLTVTWQ